MSQPPPQARSTLIWTHDYHLMLLPALLRSKLPGATISWFLHTPWPSSEVFRTLPVRSAILRALLAADLLGFHVSATLCAGPREW